MKLQPSLVVTRKIEAATPRAAHEPDKVEALAQLIVEAGALCHPLIVERAGVEAYRLLEGELAYHAAARAKELAPLTAESVLAFVVEPEQGKALRRQLTMLGARSTSIPAASSSQTDAAFVARVERHIDHQFLGLKAFIQDGLLSKVSKNLNALELLNNSECDADLHRALRATGGNYNALFALIKENRPFRSYAEAVAKVKGLSGERMVKIQDFCENNEIYAEEKPKKPRKKAPGRDLAGV